MRGTTFTLGEAEQPQTAKAVGPCPDLPVPPEERPRTLLRGAIHSAVRDAQRRLNAFHASQLAAGRPGLPDMPLREDCMFGSATHNAVLAFQRQVFPTTPAEHDGRLGPRTWARLDGAPAVPRTTRRPRVLSTERMREAWRDDVCREDRMVDVRILGRRTPANARTVAAWAALDQALRRTSYDARRVWVFNCRDIAGTTRRSLHAYGLAVDIDPAWNPNRRTPDRRPVRFSTARTQEQRLADVRSAAADTVFTPAQVMAVEDVRTVDGHQVFSWGGRWKTTKDTMHFQLSVTPDELRRGLAG